MSNINADIISSMEHEEVHKSRFQNHFRVKPFNGDVTEYTANATIHGIKYLGERRRPCGEKLYWIVIFTCCFTFLGICIRDIVVKWQNHDIILIEDKFPTPIYKIPFPAITICPQIKVKSDKFPFNEYLNKIVRGEINKTVVDLDKQKAEIAYQICNDVTMDLFHFGQSEMGLRDNLNPSHIGILHEISPTLDETILAVKYRENLLFEDSDEEYNQFAEVLTNEGICFTFNVPQEILRYDKIQKQYQYNKLKQRAINWNVDYGYNISAGYGNRFFPSFILGTGKHFGLQLHLRSAVNDINKLCQSVSGFKIILHSPSVYPTTYENYLIVDYETITNIVVKPKLIKTSENLRHFNPARRQCYFNDERSLKYFSYYNKFNCKLECLRNFTMKKFNCVQFSLPMDLGTPICGAKTRKHSQMYHYGETIETWIQMVDEMQSKSDLNSNYDKIMLLHLGCDCLPECNSIEYANKIKSEKNNFKVYERLVNNTDPSSENTVVNIFLDDVQIVGMTRSTLYSFSDLISNFGGLMGLFLGASILSFFEVIYFCALRHICKAGCKMYSRD